MPGMWLFSSLVSLVYFLPPADRAVLFDATQARTATEAKAAQQAWAKQLSVKTVEKNTVGMDLVLIPPGQFQMGSTGNHVESILQLDPSLKRERLADETPQVDVRIIKPFYLATHEVTIGQFRRFVDAKTYRTEAEEDGKGGWGWNDSRIEFEGLKPEYTWKNTGWPLTDQYPVVNVTLNDADEFLEWLSNVEGVYYRLPTEAEWEYACRAGSVELTWQGNDPERLMEIANIADATAKAKLSRYVDTKFISGKDGFVFSAPIGSFRPNPFGLYDMLGNVWERCEDVYVSKLPGGNDPLVDRGSGDYVVRGGGWFSAGSMCRSAYRNWAEPDGRDCFLGFRVVRELSDQ